MSGLPVTAREIRFLVPEGRSKIAPGETRGTAPPKNDPRPGVGAVKTVSNVRIADHTVIISYFPSVMED
jgi:hypothetical protein